ncbi:hypothetical protein HGM15179_014434, partial [Zosterops borbonicus]
DKEQKYPPVIYLSLSLGRAALPDCCEELGKDGWDIKPSTSPGALVTSLMDFHCRILLCKVEKDISQCRTEALSRPFFLVEQHERTQQTAAFIRMAACG